jgi:outer membrane protein
MSLRITTLSLALALALPGVASAADLMQAYELARQSDPQLAAAEARAFGQREGIVQARASLLPQIDATGNFNDTNADNRSLRVISINPTITSNSVSNIDSRSRNWQVAVSQSLFDYSNYTALRASRSRSEQSQADYDAALDNLSVRVSDSYFAVLTAIQTLVSAKAEELAVKRQLDQAEKRLEVGLAPITDVHEAQSRYDTARAATIAAQNAYDNAGEALTEVTGKPLVNLKGLPANFQPHLPDDLQPEHWVRTALDQNPTLRSRLLALEASERDIATARAGHLPTLSATISYSDSTSYGQIVTSGQTLPTSSQGNDASWGLQLRVPLFSGFATQSRVRQAIHTRDAVRDQAEQERRAITRQTRNALRDLLSGISEIDARQQALTSARSALDATEAGYEVGTRTIVDVLVGQQQLYAAQTELARARHNFLVNTLRLKQAAGTIEVSDVKAVNAFLIADAEAALDAETPANP